MASNYPLSPDLNLTGLTDLTNVTMDTPIRQGLHDADFWRDSPSEETTTTANFNVNNNYGQLRTPISTSSTSRVSINSRPGTSGTSHRPNTTEQISNRSSNSSECDYLNGVNPAAAAVLRGKPFTLDKFIFILLINHML